MTPQLREFVFNLPLKDEGLNDPDFKKWDIPKKKFEILRKIQDLFAQLQENDIRQTNTQELTKSFGWGQNNEGQ